ncbi:toxin-antitoxin system YwqK family antitoxin [Thalassobellus suaedae]|uniref:Toxin-antitoxin system YwqK family antitoxin n=1 Tax=Thalassobellus suaedae TaxID=3074124 RepID=A0ABY9Y2F1_9FLAO|nr:toxin-antitoxin system YwqK family antitoxin [Flavobacteriaceae bacterium HL-DH10]
MKYIVLSFVLLFSTIMTAQSINQFDANGKRDGIWRKTFENTKILRYEGAFLHGKEVGLFKFYKNINGKAVLAATREFNEANSMATAKFYTSKGKLISEGQMDGKTYIGTWKYYQKNSNALLILEHYDDLGRLEGERLVYYENGQIAEKQFYKEGKLEGASFLYSEDKVTLKAFFYVNGELHGMSKYYSPDGVLLAEGKYKRGKKDGIWKFYENGVLKEEKDFSYSPKFIKKDN